jgi:hypothetical protein
MSETTTFRDFSRKRPRIHFTIDGEEFEARKALTPARLQDAMTKFRGAKGEDAEVSATNVMEKLTGALELLLKAESYERFVMAMADEDREEPIDVPQLTEIFTWLIEKYSMRPTEALDNSSTSSKSANAGTGSLDGAPLPELTH